jgi:hypothetical protein
VPRLSVLRGVALCATLATVPHALRAMLSTRSVAVAVRARVARLGMADRCFYRRGRTRIQTRRLHRFVHCKFAEKTEMAFFRRATDAKSDSQDAQEHIAITHADEESGEAYGGDESNGPIQSQKKTQNPPEVGFRVSLRHLKCFASVTMSVQLLHCNCR